MSMLSPEEKEREDENEVNIGVVQNRIIMEDEQQQQQQQREEDCISDDSESFLEYFAYNNNTDCHLCIFQFLTIKDIIRYSMSSYQCLQDSIKELHRRRYQQFYVEHTFEYDNDNQNDQEQEENDAMISTTTTKFKVPPIKDRISNLYRVIPSSYSCSNLIRQLMLDLSSESDDGPNNNNNNNNEETVDFDAKTTIATTGEPEKKQTSSFPSLLQQLHKATMAHRIHTQLLNRCTINAKFIRFRRDNHQQNHTSSTLLLSEYIGDVLCAYYLMGHTISGIVEADGVGPTFRDWTNHVVSKLELFNGDGGGGEEEDQSSIIQHHHTDDEYYDVWYSIWIYLHSSLLRTFPFTSTQHHQLGLHHDYYYTSDTPATTTNAQQQQNYIQPAKPFCRGNGNSNNNGGLESIMIQVLRSIRWLHHNNNSSTSNNNIMMMMDHSSTVSQFGPLGPAFRGRDNIQTLTMDPMALVDRLHHSLLTVGNNKNKCLNPHDGMGLAWLGGYDRVYQWMIELQRQCTTTRPMTVLPPIMKLEPTTVATTTAAAAAAAAERPN